MASSLVLLVFMLVSGRRNRLDKRLDDLANKGNVQDADQDAVLQLARTALPKMGAAFVPEDEDKRTKLQARLIQAGLYQRQAMVLFLGVKVLLMVAPTCLGIVAYLLGLIPFNQAMIFGALAGLFGMIGPSFWLDKRKVSRQTSLRRALPDAFDVLVICLEGGVSLPGAFRRVATELRAAHPLLASELNIVQRQIQMGRSTGEALRLFGERSDLEEVRNMASVILQAEKFGASLVKALRVYAETLREKRLQHAEEMAQKAALKILFPTIFCIFPGMFIVVLGPAVIQLMDMFDRIQK
jgi:tight adherence protein C